MESTTSHTLPVQTGGIFYFPWHRHQIEGTIWKGPTVVSVLLITISNVESQVFTSNNVPGPRHRTPAVGVTSGRPNHCTTAPLCVMTLV